MALTIVVTKVSVSEQLESLWNITLNLRILDDAIEVHNQNFSARYRTGDDIADKEAQLQIDMQEVIDGYKDEQTIFDHSKMNTMVTNLNNNLVV